ncbi:glycine-rich protein 3 short isoform-like [Ipomoea triloba]|uniref:glycine-rich protein 3 short isoform-like n=1 Tax=Ipomoea triloba TaxID=35885 RepID=UPI00125DC29E|nr:glycine-rich protein 3 short isoform-like [Ipomoea triloba]
MSSKVFVLLGLSLAVFLFIASEVTAREMAETSTSFDPTKAEKANGVVGDDKHHYGGGGGGYGGGGYGHGGHGGGGYGHGGHGGGGGGGYGHGGHGGGGCKYGCCGQGYHGGCQKCCSYEGEAVDATKP